MREGGRGGAGAGGLHPGFERQQTKMNECDEAKVRGEEEKKATLEEQESL